jgi:hypothetical protein
MRCSASGSEAVRRCSGTVAKAVRVTIPVLQRIIALRSMLRSARDTRSYAPALFSPPRSARYDAAHE